MTREPACAARWCAQRYKTLLTSDLTQRDRPYSKTLAAAATAARRITPRFTARGRGSGATLAGWGHGPSGPVFSGFDSRMVHGAWLDSACPPRRRAQPLGDGSGAGMDSRSELCLGRDALKAERSRRPVAGGDAGSIPDSARTQVARL